MEFRVVLFRSYCRCVACVGGGRFLISGVRSQVRALPPARRVRECGSARPSAALAWPPEGRTPKMTDVVIAGAARPAVGSFNGSLSSLPASQLGAVAIREAMKRAKVAAAEVDEAIMGQILIAGRSEGHPSELQSLMRQS